MKRLTMLSIGALVLTACHDTADPSHPQFPAGQLNPVAASEAASPQSRIAFRSTRDGNFEIYVMKGYGTQRGELARMSAHPAFRSKGMVSAAQVSSSGGRPTGVCYGGGATRATIQDVSMTLGTGPV